jgi:transposase
MAQPLGPDALWALSAPLFPPEPAKANGGRPRGPDRAAVTGMLLVLTSGLPWAMLPQAMGCGAGMTCWRRLRDWHHAGVWPQVHPLLLAKRPEADTLDWTRAVVESRSLRAVGGGEQTGAECDGSPKTRESAARDHCCPRDSAGSTGDGGAAP